MGHIKKAAFGALLLFLIQPSQGLEALESQDLSDISDAFEITLESGETFTLPIPLSDVTFGNLSENEDFEEDSEDSQDSILTTDDRAEKKKQKKPAEKSKKAVSKKTNTAKKTNSQSKLVVVTAYSSTPDQTDLTPCITANGFNVCENGRENIIAANFLPFGTHVRLPDIYGDKVFTVQDRMHARYSARVDIWMKTRAKAKQFGVKRSRVEIIPEQVALR